MAKVAELQKFKGTRGQIRRQRVERIGAIIISLVLALWMLVNIIEAPSQFAQVAILGLRNGLLYAFIALGYTLVYGIIELINFAHGDLFMLCAVFSSFFITVWFNQDASNPAGWLTFILCLFAVMVFGAVINVLIERLAYRRLRGKECVACFVIDCKDQSLPLVFAQLLPICNQHMTVVPCQIIQTTQPLSGGMPSMLNLNDHISATGHIGANYHVFVFRWFVETNEVCSVQSQLCTPHTVTRQWKWFNCHPLRANSLKFYWPDMMECGVFDGTYGNIALQDLSVEDILGAKKIYGREASLPAVAPAATQIQDCLCDISFGAVFSSNISEPHSCHKCSGTYSETDNSQTFKSTIGNSACTPCTLCLPQTHSTWTQIVCTPAANSLCDTCSVCHKPVLRKTPTQSKSQDYNMLLTSASSSSTQCVATAQCVT